MAKCKNCGAELARDDIFCGECGARVESGSMAAAQAPDDEEEVE